MRRAWSETLIFQAAEKTDTAIFVIGRNSGGEECDRHLPEDYYLTRSEESLLKDICTHFANVVIVLNVNGLIDLSWVKKYASIKSLLFIGIPGEEGASALAGILTGEINPSGKLAVTIAEHYEDYPSADHFSWDKEHLENILDYESYGLSSEENGSTGFTKSARRDAVRSRRLAAVRISNASVADDFADAVVYRLPMLDETQQDEMVSAFLAEVTADHVRASASALLASRVKLGAVAGASEKTSKASLRAAWTKGVASPAKPWTEVRRTVSLDLTPPAGPVTAETTVLPSPKVRSPPSS